jgi:putative Mn2+ efflux pump MntP
MLKLIALIVPLGLDTFAVSTALAMAGLRSNQRLRVGLVFTAFEAGMPLVGLVVGHIVSTVFGSLADIAAIVVLVALGLFMVISREGDEAEQKLALLARTRGVAVLGLGISVSVDELAIGFTLGLLNAPLLLAVGLIGAQAFVITQIGFSIGSRVGEAVQDWAERLAGAVLLLLGVGLAIGRLTGFQL